jgi:hypothetical protein
MAATIIVAGILAFSAGTQADFYTSAEQADRTSVDVVSKVDAGGRNATILSAYFGLDDRLPPIRALACAADDATDGMPLVFSHELDPDTLQAGDFLVADTSGRKSVPACATMRPAVSLGELRTVLLIGQFGTAELDSVCVVGNLLDISRTINFKGLCARPKPIVAVVDLVFAEEVPEYQKPDCNQAKAGVLRVTFDGGVTLEGGRPVPPDYSAAYSVMLMDGTNVTPSHLGDVTDRDNNHLLCFDADAAGAWAPNNGPVRVSLQAGHFADPNEDGTNKATSVVVTQNTTPYVMPRLQDDEVRVRTRRQTAGVVLSLLIFYSLCGFLCVWCRRKTSEK